jgi:uncharacterized membrane protein YphA (DoxX/SURF4 family)
MSKILTISLAILFVLIGSSLIATGSSAVHCFNSNESYKKDNSQTFNMNVGGIVMGIFQILAAIALIFFTARNPYY